MLVLNPGCFYEHSPDGVYDLKGFVPSILQNRREKTREKWKGEKMF